jgi:hypothetical protein
MIATKSKYVSWIILSFLLQYTYRNISCL